MLKIKRFIEVSINNTVGKGFVLVSVAIIVFSSCTFAQREVQIGAYYFDGWTGTYPNHITRSLVENFSSREPIWGWKTSDQHIMDEQIVEASKAGLSFFAFCWYYHDKDRYLNEPLNRSWNFYHRSVNKNKLKYCLLVTNHVDSEIGPDEWDDLIDIWLREFATPTYVKVEGKPLLLFYELESLLRKFGSKENLQFAITKFRRRVKEQGFEDVALGVCALPTPEEANKALQIGFDILTGYNYHPIGLQNAEKQQVPIERMQSSEQRYWNMFPKNLSIKYIPVSTVGWDPRPWATPQNKYDQYPYYVGFSEKSVEISVRGLKRWIKQNPERTVGGIGILYAWNELGEGAWLTPSKGGIKPLKGVRKALYGK